MSTDDTYVLLIETAGSVVVAKIDGYQREWGKAFAEHPQPEEIRTFTKDEIACLTLKPKRQ